MIKLITGGVGAVLLAMLCLGSCTSISTGSVGVRSSFGQIDPDTIQPSPMVFKAPIFTHIDEYNVKETSIDLKDMHPKAADNLTLADLDVSVYYEVNPSAVAPLAIKYKGQTVQGDDGVWYPGQLIVERTAKSAVADAVSKLQSLTIHTQRETLSQTIVELTQKRLDVDDKGAFRITRVVIQQVNTDPSIEKTIQANIQEQKRGETLDKKNTNAVKEANILVTQADGQRRANELVSQSLTPAFLAHERNVALINAAANPNKGTIILQGGATPLINAN